MSPADWTALWVSLRLGLWVTFILLVFLIPVAWFLGRSRGLWVALIESVVTLPMVLPPTVLGFFILWTLSPIGAFGAWSEAHLGIRWVFSFPGLVLAGCISGLPFMYTALRSGMASVPAVYREASASLGKSPTATLFQVVLPNMKGALATGAILTLSHAMGEFGVVLMVGGSIPGVTKTVSIAIFEKVEGMDWSGARVLSLLILCLSYLGMVFVNLMAHRANRRNP